MKLQNIGFLFSIVITALTIWGLASTEFFYPKVNVFLWIGDALLCLMVCIFVNDLVEQKQSQEEPVTVPW